MLKRLIAFITAVMAMATQAVTVEFVTEYAPAGANPHKGWTIYTYSHWDFISDEYGVGRSPAWVESELIYTRVARYSSPKRGAVRTYTLELPTGKLGDILYIGAFEAGEKLPNVRFANKNIKQGWLELGCV